MIAPALLLFVAALLPLSAHADIHKCQIGGDTLYQEEPCPGARVPMTRGNVMMYEAPDLRELRRVLPPLTSRSRSSNSHRANLERRNERVQAQARGQIVPGMTVGQLYAMLGQPSSKRDTNNINGQSCERWSWVNPRFAERNYYSTTVCGGIVRR